MSWSFTVLTFLRLALFLQLLAIISCKKNNECNYNIEDYTHYLSADTIVIPYNGTESLTFIVQDSLGNTKDTLWFDGVGKRKFLTHGYVDWQICGEHSVQHIEEQMEFKFQNRKKLDQFLFVTLFQQKPPGARITVKVCDGYNCSKNRSLFEGWTSYFNPRSSNYRDALNVLGVSYHGVAELYTPLEFRTSQLSYFVCSFDKYAGLIRLELNKHTTWLKNP